jgi:hypothetical protein
LVTRGEHFEQNSFILQSGDHQAAVPRLLGGHQYRDVSWEELRFHGVTLNLDREGLFVRTVGGYLLLPVEREFLKIDANACLRPGSDGNCSNSTQWTGLRDAQTAADFLHAASEPWTQQFRGILHFRQMLARNT